MAKKIQEPEVITSPGQDILKHPAFGQISIHHISGSRELYGSDFAHHNYVSITISRSELHRDLSHDWYMEKEHLIEVNLSHAQFVAMIGSPNTVGQCCTINYVKGDGYVPGFPVRDSKKKYPDEIQHCIDKAVAELRQLKQHIEAGVPGVSKKALASLIGPVEHAIMQLHSNTEFVAKSFEQHMETTVEKAKTEVHAYMNNVLVRAGLEKLQGDIKLLENKSGDHDHEKES
jgi:hypothetical protein